jgi:hypothetical protein
MTLQWYNGQVCVSLYIDIIRVESIVDMLLSILNKDNKVIQHTPCVQDVDRVVLAVAYSNGKPRQNNTDLFMRIGLEYE